MQRVNVPGFCGPENELSSIIADPENQINFYCQPTPPGTGRNGLWMPGTPGTQPWVVLPDSPVRCLFQQDGRAFAVGGGTLFELSTAAAATNRGSVLEDTYMASICSNGSAGSQLFITSGGLGYIFDLNTNILTQIADPDFPSPCRMGEFMDGYFFALKTDSRSFQISALEDGTDWDPLDVFARSEGSDNVQTLIRNHREIWLLGTKTSEVWYDSGDALTPFQPIQGTFVEHGCAAPFSAVRMENTLFWLSQDDLGVAMVWMANGYIPVRVSTSAIERVLQTGGSGSTNSMLLAVGWAYQDQGQTFYVLQMPNTTLTYVYETITNLWHTRGRNVGSVLVPVYVPSPGQCHMYFAGKHLIGDRTSGAIYEQSLSIFSDTIVP
jgi:hypothetical protein